MSQAVIDFDPFVAERTRDFSGRRWVFEAVNDWLGGPDGSPVFLLTGETGVGKTAIAAPPMPVCDPKRR